MTFPNEAALRADIVRIGQLLHTRDLVDGSAGNISARLSADRILCTPSGLAKGFLELDDLIIIDMDGKLVSGKPGRKPTSELSMHLEAYRRRPDVNGVVHAHPITAVALSIAGVSLAECVIPEAIVFLGLVPTTPYATPSSDENKRAISEVIVSHDALVLAYHGSLTVGSTVMDAYFRLETLEHTAKIIALSRLMGGGPPLPPEQVTKLIATRDALGLSRPDDAQDFCAACGVCHPRGEHYPRAQPSVAAPAPTLAPTAAPARAPAQDWNDTAANAEDRLVQLIADRVRAALGKK